MSPWACLREALEEQFLLGFSEAVVDRISGAFESRFLLKNLSPEWNLTGARIRGLNRRDGGPLYGASRPNRVRSHHPASPLQERDVFNDGGIMKSIIDLGSELLFDRSRVASPYVRLLVTAIGQELAQGSPGLA